MAHIFISLYGLFHLYLPSVYLFIYIQFCHNSGLVILKIVPMLHCPLKSFWKITRKNAIKVYFHFVFGRSRFNLENKKKTRNFLINHKSGQTPLGGIARGLCGNNHRCSVKQRIIDLRVSQLPGHREFKSRSSCLPLRP